MSTVQGPRGASEGQVKNNSVTNNFIENARSLQNQLGTPASTLLQNRKDQQNPIGGMATGEQIGSQQTQADLQK